MKHIVFLIGICMTNFVFGCSFMGISNVEEATKSSLASSNIVVFAIAIKLEKYSPIKVPFHSRGIDAEEVTWLVLQTWKGGLLPGTTIITNTPNMGSACFANFYSYSPMRILYLKNIKGESLKITSIGGEQKRIDQQLQTLNNLNPFLKPYISLHTQYPPARITRPLLISKYPFWRHTSPFKNAQGEIHYKAEIDKYGKVTEVKITWWNASKPELLAVETIKQIKKATFKPATLKGVPIPITYDGKIYWEAMNK
jgi:Gram-negative bacterial TonB protein C-terminal